MRALQWTSKSLRHLEEALHGLGHSVCPHVIADGLRELGYSLQANRKTREGGGNVNTGGAGCTERQMETGRC